MGRWVTTSRSRFRLSADGFGGGGGGSFTGQGARNRFFLLVAERIESSAGYS